MVRVEVGIEIPPSMAGKEPEKKRVVTPEKEKTMSSSTAVDIIVEWTAESGRDGSREVVWVGDRARRSWKDLEMRQMIGWTTDWIEAFDSGGLKKVALTMLKTLPEELICWTRVLELKLT
jgi:hypothetical protein